MKKLERIQGCLLAGAAGDALGYEVEFLREEAIWNRFGKRGITAYALHGGLARISDDTQMTLFTACGLLAGAARGQDLAGSINGAYLDWLVTQGTWYEDRVGPVRAAWIRNDPRFHSPRAPGNTCLDALCRGGMGTPERPINGSKGCGGVMRVAPIGLYLAGKQPIEAAARLGAEAAALTHGHDLGYIPAAMLVHLIHRLVEGMELEAAVRDALAATEKAWFGSQFWPEFEALTEKAMDLAHSAVPDLEAIHVLGEGWVGEEALAIALFCALRYPDDLDSALIAAVNHKGDSDSTGAIAGNILGAYLGLAGIPTKYRENLELSDVILELAEDLNAPGANWKAKYVTCAYGKK